MKLDFYKGKNVLVTGHTGFKGSWMCRVLLSLGANVTGYSLPSPTDPSLFELCGLNDEMNSVIGDIRDLNSLRKCVDASEPDVIIHMAAQPIVRESYRNPMFTYETNVIGTVNFLEAARLYGNVRSIVNVTTDKVYRNNEWVWGYREEDALDGFDPYSNSKSCSELVTASYIRSFFSNTCTAVSTCRAGNVIGGGDFSPDRIIPDCVRAMEDGRDIIVRNPYSVRPYQHVLEPVCTYLYIAARQSENKSLASNYNIGPDFCDCVTTGDLVDLFCKTWGGGAKWVNKSEADAPHEAGFLKLDCSKIKSIFGWSPKWHIDDAVRATVEWSKAYLADGSHSAINDIMAKQISDYLS